MNYEETLPDEDEEQWWRAQDEDEAWIQEWERRQDELDKERNNDR